MNPQTIQIITYAAPPLIGGMIGYLTNRVAIRMLFRPLKAWHVFGIRVPMTPGIIPSKRHQLAENFGEMVGEQLLTAKDIGAALSEERFQDHLHLLVDNRLKDILTKDLGPFLSVVPRRFRAYARIGVRTLKYQVREGVDSYIQSDSFAATVRETVLEQMEVMGKNDLNSLLEPEGRVAFYSFIDQVMEQLLNGSELTAWLSGYIETYFTDAAAEGKSPADLMPAELQDLICTTIENQAPLILQGLSKMLSEPDVRDRIIQAIKGGVDSFLDTLGPMAAMARGFIDMDSLDETIRKYLQDKEEDLASWLQKPEVQKRVAQVLVQQTRQFLATPLSELMEKIEAGKLPAICHQAAVQVMAILRAGGVQQTLSSMIKEHLETMLNQGQISLGEVAEILLPGKNKGKTQQMLINELLVMLQSEQVSSLTGRMTNSMVDMIAKKPLGILNNLMPAGVRDGITDYIVLTANRMLIKEVPDLVNILNINEIVKNKVDALDLLRLERLILSIMEEQFKYINLFGALLGFLIGFINLVVMQLY